MRVTAVMPLRAEVRGYHNTVSGTSSHWSSTLMVALDLQLLLVFYSNLKSRWNYCEVKSRP